MIAMKNLHDIFKDSKETTRNSRYVSEDQYETFLHLIEYCTTDYNPFNIGIIRFALSHKRDIHYGDIYDFPVKEYFLYGSDCLNKNFKNDLADSLIKEVIDRLDLYSYERGINIFEEDYTYRVIVKQHIHKLNSGILLTIVEMTNYQFVTNFVPV